MIKQGDIFSYTDLFNSIDEISVFNPKDFFQTRLHTTNDGVNIFDLREQTPTKYAIMTINQYNTISSAHALDTQLKKSGYRTTYKFAHKYTMHPQMRDRILKDVYKLEYFYEIASHPDLKDKDFSSIETYIVNARDISFYYAQHLRINNPDADLDWPVQINNYQDWRQTLDTLIGIGYEFHPLDIKYHRTVFQHQDIYDETKYKEQQQFQQWCKSKYGIDTGCLVLSPKNMEKLKQILTKQEQPYFIQMAEKYLKMLFGYQL